MKHIKIGSLVLLFLLGYSCTTLKITSSWKAPDAVARNYKKIMVVGIIREADRTIRQKMEQHMTGDLKDLGYPAFSAYDVYGPKAMEGMTEEAARKKMYRDGVDAVITIVLLNKEKERYYVPGRVMYTPYVSYHREFYGYYRTLLTRIETPGYYSETTKYFWESNLYDLADNRLVYSVQTQSFTPSSTEGLAHEYGKKIVQLMISNQLLTRQEQKAVKAM